MDKSLSSYYFVQDEHVTSTKFNNILSILDEHRRMTGPISISAAASGTFTTMRYDISLSEEAAYIGGVITSGSNTLTRARFTVIYSEPSTTAWGDKYARWKNVQFVSGGAAWGYEWYATLASSASMTYGTLDSGSLGSDYTDLSTASISGFYVFRQPDTGGAI